MLGAQPILPTRRKLKLREQVAKGPNKGSNLANMSTGSTGGRVAPSRQSYLRTAGIEASRGRRNHGLQGRGTAGCSNRRSVGRVCGLPGHQCTEYKFGPLLGPT